MMSESKSPRFLQSEALVLVGLERQAKGIDICYWLWRTSPPAKAAHSYRTAMYLEGCQQMTAFVFVNTPKLSTDRARQTKSVAALSTQCVLHTGMEIEGCIAFDVSCDNLGQ